jgi:hypothetical protein
MQKLIRKCSARHFQGCGRYAGLVGAAMRARDGAAEEEEPCCDVYAAVKRQGRAFIVRDGSGAWSWALIRDLGVLWCSLWSGR